MAEILEKVESKVIILEKVEGRAIIVCAFCQGDGRDPFEAMSHLSKCQVCGGKGTVTVSEPIRECGFCGGEGVSPGLRITCQVCKGKGVVTVKEPVEKCPHCDGLGIPPSEPQSLPCIVCGGTGWISK